ncbi:hypothetical protein REPUB_Repub03eG0225800 [Reevesia pubescens]
MLGYVENTISLNKLMWQRYAVFGEVFWEAFLHQAAMHEDLDLICYIIWLIWTYRNKCYHEGYCQLNTDANWIPPAADYIKVNVDASFLSGVLGAGIGIVARDSTGKIIFFAMTHMRYVASALHGELTAILKGLQYACHWKFSILCLKVIA